MGHSLLAPALDPRITEQTPVPFYFYNFSLKGDPTEHHAVIFILNKISVSWDQQLV